MLGTRLRGCHEMCAYHGNLSWNLYDWPLSCLFSGRGNPSTTDTLSVKLYVNICIKKQVSQ